jgi:HD superfamily phosphohydrolase
MYLYDTLYGHINLPNELNSIIDTIPFQRLRYIKQLGLVHYLYPGAQHTRFEHSLGVAYLCYDLMKKIQLKQPELNISNRDVLLVSIAGLIHDIGHACFSHFFDDKLMENEIMLPLDHQNQHLKLHEARSEYIFKRIVIEENLDYTDEEVELICSYVNPKTHTSFIETIYENKFRFEIVSNSISGFDCDKLDYLVRDSYYLGNTINLNVLSLLDNAIVINDTICYPKSMMVDVYSVYHSRFIFHKKYYGNDVTRSIEYMIYDAMIKSDILKNVGDMLDTDKFYSLTDNILQIMLNSNDESSDIVKSIYERKIYKMTNEISVNIDNEIHLNEIILQIKDFLKFNSIDTDFIFDITKINYGKGKHNPIKYINFYKKVKDKYKLIDKSDDRLEKMSPRYYEEILFRIFTKSNIPDKKVYNNLRTNCVLFDNRILEGSITMETVSELITFVINDYLSANRINTKKYIYVSVDTINTDKFTI